MTANSVHDGEYLRPMAEAWYPSNPAEFRATYQQPNPRAPEYRLEGLQSMTDREVSELAAALQLAAMQDARQIQVLWAAVCEQGRRATEAQQ